MKRSRRALHEIFLKLNVGLTVSAVALGIYFFVSLIRPVYVIPSGTRGGRRGAEFPAYDPLKQIDGFSFDLFGAKRLFHTGGKRDEASGRKRHFVLQGVSMGQRTLAVIRDTSTGKTYYCSPGENIEDFRVVSVSREKVIIDMRGRLQEITR